MTQRIGVTVDKFVDDWISELEEFRTFWKKQNLPDVYPPVTWDEKYKAWITLIRTSAFNP